MPMLPGDLETLVFDAIKAQFLIEMPNAHEDQLDRACRAVAKGVAQVVPFLIANMTITVNPVAGLGSYVVPPAGAAPTTPGPAPVVLVTPVS